MDGFAHQVFDACKGICKLTILQYRNIRRLDCPGSGAYVTCRLRAHAGGLLQRLTKDFIGLRWSLPAMTSLYMGASGNLDPESGADTDGESGGSALVSQFLAQVLPDKHLHLSALINLTFTTA